MFSWQISFRSYVFLKSYSPPHPHAFKEDELIEWIDGETWQKKWSSMLTVEFRWWGFGRLQFFQLSYLLANFCNKMLGKEVIVPDT